MHFTVERCKSETAEEIEVFLDAAGLDFFIERLMLLRKGFQNSGAGHSHFMTSDWAGNELSSIKCGQDNDLVHHLKVIMLPNATHG